MLTCERDPVDVRHLRMPHYSPMTKDWRYFNGTWSRDRQSRSHPDLLLDQDPIRALDEPPIKGLSSQCRLTVVHVEFQVARVKG
jgi:hypothetical protein